MRRSSNREKQRMKGKQERGGREMISRRRHGIREESERNQRGTHHMKRVELKPTRRPSFNGVDSFLMP
ncbi:hypothetical protein BDQ12DRAFT_691866 [Crucibulum laeve]|uniref:Uncharacterized protein n=1 Tax=Crucibulum laeve TaxID=68775 RepID=A0A5C3LJW0_9AGAR|nr:hypothetical protein BDQ12DRAFT_691866 [Crucibulum laeve]